MTTTPKALPAKTMSFHNPWRTSLESCITGDSQLKHSEYIELIEELDDLYRYRSGQHEALNDAYANGRDDQREEAQQAIADSLASAGGVPWVSMRECGSHHYTPENIAAIVADLKAVEKGVEQPEWVNRDHRTSCGILWRVISALAHDVPLNADAAGGVEVVAYLVSGGRIFKDQAVTHKDSARTRIAERKDGSVAHPLVKQSDYLAALSKEREVADGLAEAVDRLIACYSVSHSPDQRKSCWDQAKAALTAHRESRGAASEAKEG